MQCFNAISRRLTAQMEEDDQQFEYTYEDEDYGDMEDDYGVSDEDEDEIIDYEGMKSALELIQKVRL